MPPKPDHSMFDDIWEESSFAAAVYDLGFEEGLKRGREESLKQAREAAQMEGARDFAQKVLERRFGSLSEVLCAALWSADMATLADIFINATTLDELKKRLGIS